MVTATPAQTNVTLEWVQVTNAEGYYTEVFSDAGGTTVMQSWTQGYQGDGSVTKFGLTASTQYWFRVRPIVGGVPVNTCSIQTFTTTA